MNDVHEIKFQDEFFPGDSLTVSSKTDSWMEIVATSKTKEQEVIIDLNKEQMVQLHAFLSKVVGS